MSSIKKVYQVLQYKYIRLNDGRAFHCMITVEDSFIFYGTAGYVTWDELIEYMLLQEPGRIETYVQGLQMKLLDNQGYEKDRHITPLLEMYKHLEKIRITLI